MAALSTSPPSQAQALIIHQGLLERDPVASADLAEAYLDYLAIHLVDRNPRIERAYCDTAAADAILSLIKNPTAYNPERGTLAAYLRMSAQGDLKNLLRREHRHRCRRASWDAVEKSAETGKEIQDTEADPARIVEQWEAVMERRTRQQTAALSEMTPDDARVLELMQAGERSTSLYSEALGITHLPFADQQRRVKQAKDRLRKRIERHG